jgi:dihydroorotate dehydrogenase
MARSNVTLSGETMRQVNEAWQDISAIWLHEGAKNALGKVLYQAGKHELGRLAIEKLANRVYDPRLATRIGGLALGGPTGLGAGHDKPGYNIQAWQAAGANFLVEGAVTWDEQHGNPMPRLYKFRRTIGDWGMNVGLNAMGFNSPGREIFAQNVSEQRQIAQVDIPVIIQVTVNKELYDERQRHIIPQRIADTISYIENYSEESLADGYSLGLSSPNTFGMRDAQTEAFLYEIIMRAMEAANGKPLDLKGDGDGGEQRLETYCELIDSTGLPIISLINTTALENIKAKYGAANKPGGLSGGDPEYQQMAVDAVRFVYEAKGDKVDINAHGGIAGPQANEQAIRLIRAGGSSLGKVTDIPRHLLRTITTTDRAVQAELDSEQAKTGKVVYLEDIIGADTRRGPKSLAS